MCVCRCGWGWGWGWVCKYRKSVYYFRGITQLLFLKTQTFVTPTTATSTRSCAAVEANTYWMAARFRQPPLEEAPALTCTHQIDGQSGNICQAAELIN